AGDLALGSARLQSAAGGLNGVRDHGAQRAIAGLLVTSQDAAAPAQDIGNGLAIAIGTIADDLAFLAQGGQELLATPVAGPFLERDPEPTQPLEKKTRGVAVTGERPALLGRKEECGLLIAVQNPSGCPAAGEPGKVFLLQNE